MAHGAAFGRIVGPVSTRAVAFLIIGLLLAAVVAIVALAPRPDPAAREAARKTSEANRQTEAKLDKEKQAVADEAVAAFLKEDIITKVDWARGEVFIRPAFWAQATFQGKQSMVIAFGVARRGRGHPDRVKVRDAMSGKLLADGGPGGVTIHP